MNGSYGCCLVISLALIRIGICEVHMSIMDMTNVIELETGLIKMLERYIQLERHKMDQLNRYMESYKKENEKALENMELYLENPINAYLIVRRLTLEWSRVELLMRMNNSKNIQGGITGYRKHLTFPTTEDLNGTIMALTRLQDTYDLDTFSVARGELDGVKHNVELSASDCFEIGKYCYEDNNFNYSYSWLSEAENRINAEMHSSVERSSILEFMALSAYKLGNISLALNVTNRLLNLLPDYPTALQMKLQYEDEIQKANGTKTADAVRKTNRMDLYQKICRGDVTPPIEILSQMKCKYMNNNNHFLLIAPFKLEEVSPQPRVVLFHDVISEKEIEVLKQLSYSRLKRAEVVNTTAGREVYSFRIGKVAWFDEPDSEHVANINRRINHMTGLSVKTAEPLQVCNYGVGGQFLPHYDFAPDLNASGLAERGFGNRIATVLFYMSDVPQGGGTAFLGPKVNIKPLKGSAVFWYNLHLNGDGDKNTVHGSCPILTGSKWVSTKWLYEYGQEFLRPCEVNGLLTNQ